MLSRPVFCAGDDPRFGLHPETDAYLIAREWLENPAKRTPEAVVQSYACSLSSIDKTLEAMPEALQQAEATMKNFRKGADREEHGKEDGTTADEPVLIKYIEKIREQKKPGGENPVIYTAIER